MPNYDVDVVSHILGGKEERATDMEDRNSRNLSHKNHGEGEKAAPCQSGSAITYGLRPSLSLEGWARSGEGGKVVMGN